MADVVFACSLGASGAGAPVVDVHSLSGTFAFDTPLFAASSSWNQPVTSAGVLATSDQQILTTYRVLLGDDSLCCPRPLSQVGRSRT